MDEKNGRRSFFKKLAVASSAIAIPGLAAWTSKSNRADMSDEKKNPVRKVKPLGFQWETADPFLFCVHHDDRFPKGNDDMGPEDDLSGRHLGQDFIVKDGYRMYHGTKVPGFPGHPHRGFETITVVRKGMVDHADSLGAAGRYGDGDVQWMTAGKGVQHSEMFPLLKKDEENPMELFQIWLNLPKANKMVEPHFKMMWQDTMPSTTKTDENGNEVELALITGKMEGMEAPTPPPDSWANDDTHHVAIMTIKMPPNSTYTLPKTEAGINRTLYFFEGSSIKVAETDVQHYHAAELEPDQDITMVNGPDAGELLLLQGKPISEPVVQHGPFVMNTREEIREAFEEYQRTQFGGWPWPKADQVHDRAKGRFALHADGTEEVKG